MFYNSKRYGYKVKLYYLNNKDISYYIKNNDGYKKVGRKSEGITEKKCIDLYNKLNSIKRHGEDLTTKNFRLLSFNDLAEKYFDSLDVSSRKKYQQTYNKHISPEFGDVNIFDLDDSYLDKLRALKISENYSIATVQQIIKLCTRICNFGVRRGIYKNTPFRDVKSFKIENTRLRYLSKDEIEKLLKESKDDIVSYLFIQLALSTGARTRSILALQKKNINLENKTITLYDFKRDNTYTGYFTSKELFEFVVNHIKNFNKNGYVVSKKGEATDYQKIYRIMTKRLSILNKDLKKEDRPNRAVLHTLRHTFASHLAIKGTPIQEIQKLMNHQDIKQTLKYAKLLDSAGQKSLDNLYEK